MKKVWKYILITFLLLIGLCCVGILYIFFVPGASLFNICYYSNNEYIQKEFSSTNISKIDLNSNSYDVLLHSTTSDKITARMQSKIFGFTTVDNANVSLDGSISGNTLSLDFNEPSGLLVSSGSYIEVYIPQDLIFDLTMTNHRADAQITSSFTKINQLSYKTSDGKLEIQNAEILGDIKLDLGNSYFKLNDSVSLHTNNVSLSLTTGKFDSTKVQLGNITISKNTRGVIVLGTCNTVEERVANAGGRIEASKILSELKIESSDTNIYVDTLEGPATITMSKSGNVSIKNLYKYSSIKTENGYIKVNNCYNNVYLESNHGNIAVLNAFNTITVVAKYSDVDIIFNEFALSNKLFNSARKVDASMSNGKLTVKGVDSITATSSNNSRFYIEMNDVSGVNTISANKGVVELKINHLSSYVLDLTDSCTGPIDVNLLEVYDYEGYHDVEYFPLNINGGSSINKLILTETSGSIDIIDTKLATL